MTSRWPSVVSRPTRAPLRSSSALVATVVPCTMRSVRASNPARSVPHSVASSPRPSMRPSDWSRGVEAHLAMTTRPVSSTAARSVNVPPTSMPIRHIFIRRGPRRPPPMPPPELDCAGNAGARGRDALVESRLIADGEPALVVLDAHARDPRLIVEDLRRRHEPADVGPACGLPEARALERLCAVQEDLLHFDTDRETGDLAPDRHRGEQVGVARDARATIHPQRLATGRHEEQQPDVRIGQDVPHAVEPFVAG